MYGGGGGTQIHCLSTKYQNGSVEILQNPTPVKALKIKYKSNHTHSAEECPCD